MSAPKLVFALVLLLLSNCLWGQLNTTKTKITLKNGAVFVGELLLKNDEVIMLKDAKGARIQFAISELAQVESSNFEATTVNESLASISSKVSNFCGQIELSTGDTWAEKVTGSASLSGSTLTFGNRKAFGKNLFAGIGAGYLFISDIHLQLIPATLKIQSYLSKNRTAPFLGFESGYAFSASKNYDGGVFAKVSFGINHRLNFKSALYAGVSAAVYRFTGDLSEIVNGSTYHFSGTTSLHVLALQAGFQF